MWLGGWGTLISALAHIMFMVTLSNIEMSIPCFEIMLGLLQSVRSIQGNEVLMICVGLSVICLYPTDDVR